MDQKQEEFLSHEDTSDSSHGENWATRGTSGIARTQDDENDAAHLVRTEVLQGTTLGDQRVRKTYATHS